MSQINEDWITLTQAAKIAGRSKATVARWVNEGWVEAEFTVPVRNGSKLLDRQEFEAKLPAILSEMESRKGRGRNFKAGDAYGNPRPPKVRKAPVGDAEGGVVLS